MSERSKESNLPYIVRTGPIKCSSCGYEDAYISNNGKNEYIECFTCGFHAKY